MGIFYTECSIEHHVHRSKSVHIPKLLVDMGSEYAWIPENTLNKIHLSPEKKDVVFVMANGQHVSRNVGFAVVRVGDHFTIDEVVFGREGDLALLGARTLEGLNLAVDPRRKKLVAAGPLPAA